MWKACPGEFSDHAGDHAAENCRSERNASPLEQTEDNRAVEQGRFPIPTERIQEASCRRDPCDVSQQRDQSGFRLRLRFWLLDGTPQAFRTAPLAGFEAIGEIVDPVSFRALIT